MESKGKRIIETALLFALSASLLVGTWTSAEQRDISEKLVRLHVLAVSDDEYEQELKLRVRDSVLKYLRPKLENVSGSAESRELLQNELEGIARAAAGAAEGRRVSVALGRESYPTKQYENFALPAGKYNSLKVVLGDGKGRNWWCVVFPPLCTGAVSCDRLQSVMSDTGYAIITEEEGYELRFKALELWGELSALFG